MHMSKRIEKKGIFKKSIVLGMVQRNGEVKAIKVEDTKQNTLKGAIYNNIKENSLIKEIEAERLKISLEQEEFIKKYEKGEISDAIADLTIDKISQKYKELEIKVDELNGVREDIKAFDSKGNQKEKEFYKEMQKHKTRTLTEFEKGY